MNRYLQRTRQRLLPLIALLTLPTLSVCAQEAETPAADTPSPQTATTLKALPATPRYGFCSMTALLQSLPEYAQAMEAMQQLRERYELEAQHNEDDFRRRFQEYLQGQKNFPEPILLKRQGDLERAMEEGLEFRRQADSLLVVAERDLLTPLRKRVEGVVKSIGTERGYDYVIDTDLAAFPFLNPALSEDITADALAKLQKASLPATHK